MWVRDFESCGNGLPGNSFIILHGVNCALISLTFCDTNDRHSAQLRLVEEKWRLYCKDTGESCGTQKLEFSWGLGITIAKGSNSPRSLSTSHITTSFLASTSALPSLCKLTYFPHSSDLVMGNMASRSSQDTHLVIQPQKKETFHSLRPKTKTPGEADIQDQLGFTSAHQLCLVAGTGCNIAAPP